MRKGLLRKIWRMVDLNPHSKEYQHTEQEAIKFIFRLKSYAKSAPTFKMRVGYEEKAEIYESALNCVIKQ